MAHQRRVSCGNVLEQLAIKIELLTLDSRRSEAQLSERKQTERVDTPERMPTVVRDLQTVWPLLLRRNTI